MINNITDPDYKTHKGLIFKKLYTEEQCTKIINNLAEQINTFYQQLYQQQENKLQFEVVALCFLKGAFMFYTDICRNFKFKLLCDFVKVSSYQGQNSLGDIKIQGNFNPQKFKGKHVLIIEDMADTGITLKKFKAIMEKNEPKSLKIAVLVNRPDRPKDFVIDWIGLNCSDFIIGYGLDFDQFGRNFPAIYQKVDKKE